MIIILAYLSYLESYVPQHLEINSAIRNDFLIVGPLFTCISSYYVSKMHTDPVCACAQVWTHTGSFYLTFSTILYKWINTWTDLLFSLCGSI